MSSGMVWVWNPSWKSFSPRISAGAAVALGASSVPTGTPGAASFVRPVFSESWGGLVVPVPAGTWPCALGVVRPSTTLGGLRGPSTFGNHDLWPRGMFCVFPHPGSVLCSWRFWHSVRHPRWAPSPPVFHLPRSPSAFLFRFPGDFSQIDLLLKYF